MSAGDMKQQRRSRKRNRPNKAKVKRDQRRRKAANESQARKPKVAEVHQGTEADADDAPQNLGRVARMLGRGKK